MVGQFFGPVAGHPLGKLPCPLCGKLTIQVLGATMRLDEEEQLAFRCVGCWGKVKEKEMK